MLITIRGKKMKIIKSIIFFLILSTLVEQLIGQTRYKPYVRLITGFMLISLMIRPIFGFLGNEADVEDVFSRMASNAESLSFQDDAKEAKEEQVCQELETILKKYKIKAEEIRISLDSEGEVASVSIEAAGAKNREKALKRVISNFYNVKNSNINISE